MRSPVSCRASLCHGTTPADVHRLLPACTAGQSLPKGASQCRNLPQSISLQNQHRSRRFFFLHLFHPVVPAAIAPRQEKPRCTQPKAESVLSSSPRRAADIAWAPPVFASSADSLNSRREAQPAWELPRHAQHLSPTAPRRNDSPESSKAGLSLAVCCPINTWLRGDAPPSPN